MRPDPTLVQPLEDAAPFIGFRDRAQRAHMVAVRLQPAQYLARSFEAHASLVDLIRSGDAQRASDAHLDQRRRGHADDLHLSPGRIGQWP